MKIKTKFRLMYYPIAFLVSPFYLLTMCGDISDWIAAQALRYKNWCFYKSGWYIRDERGITIENPKVEKE